jgi:DNA-binding NarL/FixJ family response regulator
MKKIRIVLAEDHSVVREGLQLLINRQPDMEVVGEAATGIEALTQARRLTPDIVVMDLSMPELNGLQATTELGRTGGSGIRVIALTTHEDALYLRQMCKAGAAGYVLKRSAGDELLKAIRSVAAGRPHFDAGLAAKALASQSRENPGKRELHTSELSAREVEVLRGIALGHTNKELASQLGVSVKTIETYKERISAKLGLRSRAQMVQFALRNGWLGDDSSMLRAAV